jgi:peptidoglycan/xylan/chitin deacetylase (PgdA/CDA1 family)
MYHDVGDGIPPELFKAQMEYLSRHTMVMPLEALLRIARSGSSRGTSCAITFDDGYEGVYRHALPSLRALGFPAMTYLSTGFIRDRNGGGRCVGQSGLCEGRPLLSWRQVREMEREGMRFGSHLSEHGDLSVLGRCEAVVQLLRSRDEIEQRLGKSCTHFAYPFGRLTMQSVSWVREAGYRTAVTTVHRPLAPDDDMLRLPRMGIEERYTLRDFVRVVVGDWDFIGQLQTLRRPAMRT